MELLGCARSFDKLGLEQSVYAKKKKDQISEEKVQANFSNMQKMHLPGCCN